MIINEICPGKPESKFRSFSQDFFANSGYRARYSPTFPGHTPVTGKQPVILENMRIPALSQPIRQRAESTTKTIFCGIL
jgi:hypothetical protein